MLTLLFAINPPRVHAQAATLPDSISFETALQHFLHYNPGLEEARARAGRAAWQAQVPALWPNPALEGDAESASSQQSLVLDQPVPNPFVRHARLAVARAEAEAAHWSFREEAGDLYLELRRRYLASAASEARLRALEAITQTMRRAVEVARVRLEEGDLGPYDVERLQVAVATYEDALAQASVERSVAHAALASFITPGPTAGVDTLHTRFVATDTLRYTSVTLDEAGLMEHAIRLRARVVAARKTVEVSEQTFRAERAARWPGVSLRAGLGREIGAEGVSTGPVLGLGVEVPLWNRNGVQVRVAEAALVASTAALEVARREVLLEVEAALARLRSYRTRIGRIGGTLLAGTDSLLAHALYLYQEGEVGLVELLDAADAAREARLLRLDLLQGYLESRYELDRAVGLLPEELERIVVPH